MADKAKLKLDVNYANRKYFKRYEQPEVVSFTVSSFEFSRLYDRLDSAVTYISKLLRSKFRR